MYIFTIQNIEISNEFINPIIEIDNIDYLGIINIPSNNLLLPIENNCNNFYLDIKSGCKYLNNSFIIFHKSKSLIPCIITHSLMNALSIFNIENSLSLYVSSIFLIIVPLVYAFDINRRFKEQH